MKFEEWTSVAGKGGVPEGWRIGQTWYHSLFIVRPGIAIQVIGHLGVDPYDTDSNMPRFLAFVKDCWEVSDKDHIKRYAKVYGHKWTKHLLTSPLKNRI